MQMMNSNKKLYIIRLIIFMTEYEQIVIKIETKQNSLKELSLIVCSKCHNRTQLAMAITLMDDFNTSSCVTIQKL